MDRPALFDTGPALATKRETQAEIPWPGGKVAWACGDPVSSRADMVWRDGDRRIFAWRLTSARVELALWPVAPDLPAGMRIDAAWMGHWRVRLDAAGTPPVLRCGPADGRAGFHAGPEPGEWLVAQTWEDAGRHLTVGTEDEEALADRAATTLPEAWEPELRALWSRERPADARWPAVAHPDGIDLVLPPAPAGAVIDVHHAAAWCDRPRSHDDLATWFAVDGARAALPPALR